MRSPYLGLKLLPGRPPVCTAHASAVAEFGLPRLQAVLSWPYSGCMLSSARMRRITCASVSAAVALNSPKLSEKPKQRRHELREIIRPAAQAQVHRRGGPLRRGARLAPSWCSCVCCASPATSVASRCGGWASCREPHRSSGGRVRLLRSPAPASLSTDSGPKQLQLRMHAEAFDAIPRHAAASVLRPCAYRAASMLRCTWFIVRRDIAPRPPSVPAGAPCRPPVAMHHRPGKAAAPLASRGRGCAHRFTRLHESRVLPARRSSTRGGGRGRPTTARACGW